MSTLCDIQQARLKAEQDELANQVKTKRRGGGGGGAKKADDSGGSNEPLTKQRKEKITLGTGDNPLD